MKYTIIALMEDRPGVLSRVASLFRRRNFNIASLAVGASEIPGISRMTIVVDVDSSTRAIEQVTKQLYKVINVTKVSDVTHDPIVARELALIKVTATSATRGEIIELVNVYRANIVDVAPDSLIIEVTGDEEKIDSMLVLLRGFGIKEMLRTGRVAMLRGVAGRTTSAAGEGPSK